MPVVTGGALGSGFDPTARPLPALQKQRSQQ